VPIEAGIQLDAIGAADPVTRAKSGMRPTDQTSNDSAGVPLATRIALLQQHGTFTQAYSAALQPGLQHFGDERGFIAYKTVAGTALVLSDPVAPQAGRDELIRRFVRANPDACFWQISRPVASLLVPLGFKINELGPDTRIDLASYDFGGQQKKNLRKAAMTVAKLGYVIREGSLASVDKNELGNVSQAWRRTRTVRRREVSFLNRPLVFEEEADVRWFFTFGPDGKLVAFGSCDPIYEHGAVVGYSIATRRLPSAHPLVGHALKRYAIEVFQKEGKRWVFLGLSLGYGIRDEQFKSSRGVRRSLRVAYHSRFFNRFFYPLQGLALNKRQFGGVMEQTYYAFNQRPSITRVLKVLRACDII
jgi:lysylphosphatidylglycerol synthetase-like protein (DUF2156 family)